MEHLFFVHFFNFFENVKAYTHIDFNKYFSRKLKQIFFLKKFKMGQSVPSIKAKMFCQMSIAMYIHMYVYFLEICNVFLFIVPVTGQSKFKVIIKTLGSSTRSSCTYSSSSASLYWLFRSEEDFRSLLT